MEEQFLIRRTSCVECDGTQAERQSLEGVEQPCVNFKERIVKEDIASVAGEQQKFREAAAAGNFAVRRDEETMPRPRLEEPVVAQISRSVGSGSERFRRENTISMTYWRISM